MANDLKQTLDRIASKARIFTERYNVLLKEKAQADSQIAELQAELDACRKQIQQLSQQIEYLQIVTTLTPDRSQMEKSRNIIANLVREIDRSILELNE